MASKFSRAAGRPAARKHARLLARTIEEDTRFGSRHASWNPPQPTQAIPVTAP